MRAAALLTLALLPGADAQIRKAHRDYLCDDPGKLDGLRIQRTMDFVLCRERHEDAYCYECRCEWLLYWEAAQACFGADKDYRTRLQESQERWKLDYSVMCLGLDETEVVDDGLLFSLEADDAEYCNDATRAGSAILAVVTALAAQPWR